MITGLLVFTSGCINVTHYTDGQLTQYFSEPIPKLSQPIARTLSLEKVTFQTAANFKGRMIGDMIAREIYIIPADIGREVKTTLNLDKEYSKEATYQGLNILAKNRTKARHMWSGATQTALPMNTVSSSTDGYIQCQSSMAKEAYKKGEYLKGDIHNSAAISSLRSKHAGERTLAVAGTTFAVLNAMAAAGEAIIKSEFIDLRNWIEFKSGAIGKQAPEGSHLSVFFLRFFDAKSFQLDSRNRVAVFMVLTDKNGKSTSVLEGSDILNCEGECNLFQPKPTAKILNIQTHSPDVQKQLWKPDGLGYLNDNGFDNISGIYQYLLLQHGLQKLSAEQ
jgi:hypothetical protein